MVDKYSEFDEIASRELSERCGAYHAAYVRCKKAETALKLTPLISKVRDEAQNAFEDLEIATQSLIAKHDLVLECIRSLFAEFGVFEQKGTRMNIYKSTFHDPYDTELVKDENVIEINVAIENE